MDTEDFKNASKVCMTGLVLFPTGIGMEFGVWAGVAASGFECIMLGLCAAVMIVMMDGK